MTKKYPKKGISLSLSYSEAENYEFFHIFQYFFKLIR